MEKIKKVVRASAPKATKAVKKVSVEQWLKAYIKHKTSPRENGAKGKAAEELAKLEAALLKQL
tara:strand:- start:169 stop:357 length:189 start_codon:yes stop_codon:yes gene_type:complete